MSTKSYICYNLKYNYPYRYTSKSEEGFVIHFYKDYKSLEINLTKCKTVPNLTLLSLNLLVFETCVLLNLLCVRSSNLEYVIPSIPVRYCNPLSKLITHRCFSDNHPIRSSSSDHLVSSLSNQLHNPINSRLSKPKDKDIGVFFIRLSAYPN